MGKYCIDELPNRLEDGKLRECLIASNNGDENARSELISHNLKLVVKMIEKYFYYVPYDKEDLFEVGVIGLIKSIDNFDLTKDNSFTSFASKCILNEIKMYMRKEKNYLNYASLDFFISENVSLVDIVEDKNINIEDDYIDKDDLNILKDFLNTFSERDRLIMTLYFGLEGDAKSQQEIANIVGLSQSFTSRIIKSCIEKLKIFLQNNGYDNIKIGIDRRNCHSPYEYFSNYEKSVVDKAIDRLSEEEKQIFWLYFTNRKELNKCFTLITGCKINGLGRYISKCTRKVEEYLLINKIYINDEVKSRKEEDIESEFIPLKVDISRVRKR